MQRQVRINESQVLMLAEKAKNDHAMTGYLWKRSADNSKWKVRWFTLYQNLLFYQETSNSRVSGLIFLEGSYCERVVIASASDKGRDAAEKQHCFAVRFRQEGLRQYELRTEIDSDCELWIDAIKQASFNSLLLLKEELEQKHLHLLQIVESEKTAKWQYAQQCEEFTCEIKKLHSEVCVLKKELRRFPATTQDEEQPTVEESDEIRKIKKVQSFFRGWLCRRRWKQIVEEYIHSPHAENMRKRNSLVFRMVEAEEEYVEQLQLLVACFLRPFKMAASSKTPTCTHNDVNSIFLNSETVMFLHQIFLKGLTARMESWPTLVLGDLFDMLLPMLSIYQEYVRNHHFSLQVLAECKQNPRFVALLTRLESKASLQGRSLETFLTYPMHQIPRYIITLHELLAHTPHNHVERRSLEDARAKLEELSKQMHDEVSETENIRKNLSIERMIVEGCDLLLDVNQVYVRQGTLIQLPNEKSKSQRNPFKTSEKGAARQCFLFANHMILTTRIPGGRLHLVPTVGKVPLSDATLIEDPSEQSFLEEDDSPGSSSGESSLAASGYSSSRGSESQSLDFKLIVDVKSGPPLVVHLLAPSLQEKAAWISDIIHCMDNVHFNDLFHGTVNNSSVTMPTSIRNDPRLFKDDIDIRFSRTLNSCKVPQIRYATPERLLERLTDLRFLSIDFLNTFLLTYRVFTDGVTVLEALKKVYYNPEVHEVPFYGMAGIDTGAESGQCELSPPECDNLRRISTSSVASSEPGEWDRDRAFSHDSRMGIPPPQHWRWSHRKSEAYEYRKAGEDVQRKLTASNEEQMRVDTAKVAKSSLLTPGVGSTQAASNEGVTLDIPKTPLSSTSSCDTLIGHNPDTPSSVRTSTRTLVADENDNKEDTKEDKDLKRLPSIDTSDDALSPEQAVRSPPPYSSQSSYYYYCRRSVASTISSKRGSADTSTDSSLTSPRSSFQHQESPQHTSKAGVVITSHRASQRRSSTSSAAAAFAVATAGSSNPRDFLMATPRSSIGHRYSTVSVESRQSCKDRVSAQKRESMICTAATMRVLNVLRHWVSKHSQDFESDHKLKEMTIDFLDELVGNSNLLPVEHKAATQLLRLMTKEQQMSDHVDLDLLLAPPMVPSKETLETLSALELAEHITYLDHKIFVAIRSEEFLSQAWMKADRMTRAPNITLITRRFNDMSRLVVSEIIRQTNLATRVSVIEKWAAVADICRCLHNFNGVLQICSAFMNSAVFRLKKTWEKVSKTTRQTNQKLQNLVSADGRFRNLREALHRSDPPCIPYLGMYLTDLSFIEEGTPNFTEDNLLNFSKMRMVAHVIREIRHFQQTPYKIDVIAKVTNYLLDASLLIPEDVLYKKSLELEPRQSRLGSISS